MRHKVVVLGAGYAGVPAAARLANQVRDDEVEVTMVNPSPDFVERPRLHQLSMGQRLRHLPLRGFLERAGVKLVVGKATGIDLASRKVTIATGSAARTVAYDTLVYGIGSTIDLTRAPGVARYAHAFTGPDAAAALHAHVQEVAASRGTFVVVGGGLTGIEAATEIAETYPQMRVVLVSDQPPGNWLSPRAQKYLRGALDRLGVRVCSGVRVDEVRENRLVLADGEELPFDGCLWAGGFTVPALAGESGLAVNAGGRVLVDPTLRSWSHPEVYAVGDAAAASGPWGECVAMGCRSGGFTGPYVADAIADRLAGRTPKPFTFRYFHECISLGRRDGLIQFLHADERPHNTILTGRLAVRYKEVVLASAPRMFRSPGPYLPRRRRLASPTQHTTLGIAMADRRR